MKYSIGVKELSRVVYSAERGKLETVLLKPSAGGNKGSFEVKTINSTSIYFLPEESPPKMPKVTSLSSSTLTSLGGTATGGKLKPSYYSKKAKHKDDSNVRSPPLKLIEISFICLYF